MFEDRVRDCGLALVWWVLSSATRRASAYHTVYGIHLQGFGFLFDTGTNVKVNGP